MARIVYVNGRYESYASAAVHVEDRGFQFADSVYEVCEIYGGKLIDLSRHLERLNRSLAELEIPKPMSQPALRHVMTEVVKRNRVKDGMLYLQVSRGVARRDFIFPTQPALKPTLVCLARPAKPGAIDALAGQGIKVITQPDPRWQRCDIKTVMLLPAVLAKQQALRDGVREVWFTDASGQITEGASSTAWIISRDQVLLTRPLSHAILPGVTRMTVMDEVRALGLRVDERSFSVAEAEQASEAFQTSASGTVMPVIKINDSQIGDGQPGAVAQRLRRRFHDFADAH